MSGFQTNEIERVRQNAKNPNCETDNDLQNDNIVLSQFLLGEGQGWIFNEWMFN